MNSCAEILCGWPGWGGEQEMLEGHPRRRGEDRGARSLGLGAAGAGRSRRPVPPGQSCAPVCGRQGVFLHNACLSFLAHTVGGNQPCEFTVRTERKERAGQAVVQVSSYPVASVTLLLPEGAVHASTGSMAAAMPRSTAPACRSSAVDTLLLQSWACSAQACR